MNDDRRPVQLLAATGTSDVVDAHVAITAGHHHATIVTSDPDDLHVLAPRLPRIAV